ncbi:hypothetical protein OZX72_09420 [Bifidobacterium sp. ESL0769]|uniref:hypothetical protein n=1 Tax=Bifidobacterium sp. ESL0769 TaxID=2983229 RepID=UPI0023F8BD6E|nr:hypothetical protein [Bifidobacterium sp. ESL0769]WEV67430.1 hypothetical protein OZX72_09420 [Bifidobacterium sp. ESL0769]
MGLAVGVAAALVWVRPAVVEEVAEEDEDVKEAWVWIVDDAETEVEVAAVAELEVTVWLEVATEFELFD